MKLFSFPPLLFILTLFLIGCTDNDNNSFDDSGSQADDSGSQALVACDTTPEVLQTSDGVEFVRTPDSCFEDLQDFPYSSKYVEIEGLRQAYVEEGPSDGEVVLLLHGQPSWSYLYRKMIPVLANNGYRVIAMDHLGLGRSDKPIDIDDYTYLGHYDRLVSFIELLRLRDVNLFAQDWGSLIGLRVAGLNPEWFASIAVGNGALPNVAQDVQLFPPVENPNDIEEIPSPFADIPDQQFAFYDGCELLIAREDNSYFGNWMEYAMKGASFSASEVLEANTWFPISEGVEAAYDAPFPSRTYMAGIRKFPSIANELGGLNEEAVAGLLSYQKPFLTIWASNDGGQMGGCEAQNFFIDNVPGAAGQAHTRLPESSHFLQDDQGEEIARRLVDFYENNRNTEPEVGFEILQTVSETEIIVWINDEMTQAEFDAIELPSGWIKNQPREGEAIEASFSRSPDANTDGPLVEQELFGHTWRHNATIVETGISMDDQGLFNATYVAKYHNLTYGTETPISLLIGPDGEQYIRVSRDAGRTSEVPTLPSGWQLFELTIDERLVLTLPNPTLNIRGNNEDSFQGPIEPIDLTDAVDVVNTGVAAPLELTTSLCENPSNLDPLMDALMSGGSGGNGPTFGDANPETFQQMLSAPTEGPFYMVNLIRFREWAEYPDGRETDLTGREANDLYNADLFIDSIGGLIVFAGDVTGTTLGEDEAWDQVAIVEYPCPLAFIAMMVHPEFQETEIHKEAGVEESIVMMTYLQTSEDLPAISETGFYTVDVYQVGDQATYPNNSEKPDRTGEEALALFESSIETARLEQGIGISAHLLVDGVVIGDGRDFHEVWVHAVPSTDAHESFLSDPDVVEAIRHRDAALTDGYGMIVGEALSDFPEVSDPPENEVIVDEAFSDFPEVLDPPENEVIVDEAFSDFPEVSDSSENEVIVGEAFSDFPEVSDPPENEVIEQRELQVGSFVFNARVAGPENGELVLLLHGFPETSLAWRAQLPALAKAGYFAVAPDLRGISPDAQPPNVDDYRMHLIVEDILGMAEALGRERFHVIGHDFGAIAAWEVAATTPNRINTLTAFAVPHPDPFIEEANDPSSCQYEASSYFESLTPAGSEQAFLANDGAALRSLFPGFPRDVVNEYIEVLSTGDTMRAAVDWYRANTSGRELSLSNYPYGDVSVDTLMIWGDADGAVCRESVEATGAFVTGEYQLEILEGVDHWVPERVPELVNPWILEHLTVADPGTGQLPITQYGVGTPCSSDDDCVGIGTCLIDGDGSGFCTRQCGSGECGDPYVCCHSCSELVAPQLPFSDSACLVGEISEQLTASPASCTCN